MQPPLPIGTVLQNRYRLAKILGQGGFGRTYLAQDQGRFNELCALKELIPSQTGVYSVEKYKELFQREASALYQIQHAQIPQFRATFEQDGRLFLVQDYVEGKTYRTLLKERRAEGKRFSEGEVLQLLQQLLPVLHHIHGKGIIHRDISPDNIILRDRDRLPVLIDFGVVKELATRFQYSSTPPATMVGKMGYAPLEQIQTGRAYPSSDLYALAVTAIVLLTVQEPQVLFDEATLTWNWYRWIPPINSGLTQVLNKMLSYRPGDRYQEAREVARALADALNLQPQTQKPPQAYAPTSANTSQMQTVAVGGRPEPRQGVAKSVEVGETPEKESAMPSQKPDPVTTPTSSSNWDNPWIVAFVGVILAILAGVGSWALVSYLLNHQLLVR
ncbi:protein kinase, partial [Planktothrix sp. FACHB-1355]